MRSLASQVSNTIFTIFFTCNNNTSVTEDEVLCYVDVDVTLVRDDVSESGSQTILSALY